MANGDQLKEIEIEGVGTFQVPDSYTDDQVKAHIQNLRQTKPHIFSAAPEVQPGAFQTRKGGLTYNAAQVQGPTQFEQERTEGTGEKIRRGAALGAFSGLGIPETETPVQDLARGLGQRPSLVRALDPTGGAITEGLIPMAKSAYGAGKDILSGDPEQMAHGVASLGTQAATLRGIGKTESLGPNLEPRRARLGTEGLSTALRTPAGRAGARAESMTANVDVARGDIAEIARSSPLKAKGAARFEEMADAIDTYKDRLWSEQHKPPVERQAQRPFNQQPVINRALGEITADDVRLDKSGADASQKWVQEAFGDPMTIKNADNSIRILNQQIKKLPETYGDIGKRVRQAALSELRNQLDTQLEAAGEAGVKNVNRRWGALSSIADRLRERGPGLVQQEGRAPLLPDWAHLYAFLHPTGTAVGVGLRGLGRALQPTEGAILGKAVKRLGRSSLAAPEPGMPGTPYEPPLPPRIAGLLGRGPLVTPPPGYSVRLPEEILEETPRGLPPRRLLGRGRRASEE